MSDYKYGYLNGNKINPGDNYRLLGIDETVCDGDEFYHSDTNKWHPCQDSIGKTVAKNLCQCEFYLGFRRNVAVAKSRKFWLVWSPDVKFTMIERRDKAQAIREAIGLKLLNQNCNFYVMESCAEIVPQCGFEAREIA